MRFLTLSRILLAISLLILVGLNFALLHQNPGLNGHDAYAHLGWIRDFHAAQLAGDWYPRWLPNSYYGFGSPAFFYYPPLVYFVASAIQTIAVGLGVNLLLHTTQFLFSLLSVGAMYFLLGEYRGASDRGLRILLAGYYGFGLYRFMDVVFRDALTEHAAFVWLPFVLIGLERLFKNRHSRSGLFWLWFGGSTVLLSNIPATILAVYLVAALLFFRRSQLSVELLKRVMLAAIMVALTTALYWLPMLEHFGDLRTFDYFQTNPKVSTWAYFLLDVFQHPVKFVYAGVIEILLLSYLYIVTRDVGQERRPYRKLLLIALLFQLPFLATPFLAYLPLLHWIQFSFRWMIVSLLVLPVVILAAPERAQCRALVVMAGVTFLTIGYLLHGLEPKFAHTASALELDLTSSHPAEYLPKTVLVSPYQSFWTMTLAGGDGIVVRPRACNIVTTKAEPRAIDFESNLATPTDLTLHLAYFEEWQAEINGSPADLWSDKFGITHVRAPAGHSRITISMQHSSTEILAFWISLLSLIGTAGYFTFQTKKRPNHF